jgi:hypothetical protein
VAQKKKMAKSKKCRLIFHGMMREIDMGIFDSISAAKKYVRECWDRPYTIKPIIANKLP